MYSSLGLIKSSKPKQPVKMAATMTTITITARTMGKIGFFLAAAAPAGAALEAAPTDAAESAAGAGL